jgi:hypothetical protein
MFEIMASGSVLLTDEADDYGLKELFVDESYCTYKRDGSDVSEKASMIINDSAYRDSVTKKAVQCIQEKHTHETRAKELIAIITKNFKISNQLPFKLWLIDKLCSSNELHQIIKTKQPNLIINSNIELELTTNELFNLLISLNIKFWLLKETCLEAIIYRRLSQEKLIVGVQSSQIKEFVESKIQNHKLSIIVDSNRETKKMMIIHEQGIVVPKPVVGYLEKVFGKEFEKLKNEE